jgi:hypothetical protein
MGGLSSAYGVRLIFHYGQVRVAHRCSSKHQEVDLRDASRQESAGMWSAKRSCSLVRSAWGRSRSG